MNEVRFAVYPPIAQLVEHPTLNRLVVGSNPAGRTIFVLVSHVSHWVIC